MKQRPLTKQVTNKERLERFVKSGKIIKGSAFLGRQQSERFTRSQAIISKLGNNT